MQTNTAFMPAPGDRDVTETPASTAVPNTDLPITDVSSTDVSSTDVPGATPRDARVTTILLIGRIATDTRDDLCRVRNVSDGGMRLETLAPVAIGQEIDVELKNGITVRSEGVWRENAEAGVRFC